MLTSLQAPQGTMNLELEPFNAGGNGMVTNKLRQREGNITELVSARS